LKINKNNWHIQRDEAQIYLFSALSTNAFRRQLMRAYLHILKGSFKSRLAYPSELKIAIPLIALRIYFYIALWKAVYGTTSNMAGISLQDMITYAIIRRAINKILFPDADMIIGREINSGDISLKLLKPISFLGTVTAQIWGNTVFYVLSESIPSLLIASFFARILYPSSLSTFLLFIASLLLGHLVMLLIQFLTGMVSFWTKSEEHFSYILDLIILGLSGSFVPLWFFPPLLRRIATFLPFGSTFHVPLSIYIGQYKSYEIPMILSLQGAWIITLSILVYFVWRKGLKALVIQGG